MSYQPLYLVMVTSDINHNKFYRMIPEGNTFRVEYGRIGNDYVATDSYPISQWDKKLKEKLKKGYVDQTRLVAMPTSGSVSKTGYADISDSSIAAIVKRLQVLAKQAIEENYTILSTKVTQTMIDEAQGLINDLSIRNENNYLFNQTLLELFRTIPRKMDKVANYTAHSRSDYAKILQREQDLLDVMRGQVVQQEVEKDIDETDAKLTILEALGLQIFQTNESEKNIIREKLQELKPKLNNAWRIVNTKTQTNFDSFVQQNNIKNKQLFWHGSRNENWWSILNSGLILRPNAVITGKMFGEGIYFAPLAKKSFNYTSYNGTYWARGNSNVAFMSLFDVAYGNPYHVYSHGNYGSFNYERLQQAQAGAHCLHAHAGQILYNDEVVVYKENQVTIKYLVELT